MIGIFLLRRTTAAKDIVIRSGRIEISENSGITVVPMISISWLLWVMCKYVKWIVVCVALESNSIESGTTPSTCMHMLRT